MIKRLIELADQAAREHVGDYYIVPKARLDNIRYCLDQGALRIRELTQTIESQQAEIARLGKQMTEVKESE